MKHYNAHGQIDHSDTSEGGYYVRVEDRRNYGCLIVIIGLLIVLALGMFITSKVGAESARIPQAGNCHNRVNHSESMVYVVGYYSCESIPQTGLKSDYMIPEETYIPVDAESRKTGKGESEESISTESPVADENPPSDDKKDDSDNGKDTPKDSDDNEKDKKGNNGHGNNADGVDSSNPGHGPRNEDGADESAPVDDENRGASSLPFFAGLVFVTFKKGRNEYTATVSHVGIESDGHLWLYQFADEEKGIVANCGYIKGAKIVSVGSSYIGNPYISDEVLKILHLWS